ncbi:helix-turn-helix transcriptional regulator [Paenibacillus alkaliterrae]|uniref:winged helix-turn-helix transcriptional regulator n=1 Tax=Paenibacillus alkaliterrae TaxID=320909 RepID=UPI001F2769D3|nr:helix-turn-helix domain-containing protein [Paenibacillus alkaliterrae]MCF2939386.1 helix-turn-helix transcriptional regulator [Paenibacillus alkaliterrae]
MGDAIPIKQADISISACSYRRVLEIISSKWSALVIYALEDGMLRYGEVRKRIEGISQKMLTQTLRQMERDGLVRREVTPTVPPVVDYSLTPLGETLIGTMKHLKLWTAEYFPLVERAREEYDRSNGRDEG